MNKMYDDSSIAVTFQLSLDAFLDVSHPKQHHHKKQYEQALDKLGEARRIRSPQKKCAIADEAILLHPDCIEAYLVKGLYAPDIWERITVYRKGMELATMNLGKDFFLRSDITDYIACPESKSLFRIKYAYACTLYEAGYMRKAQRQFLELLNLNPSDFFQVHHYLLATYIYFEEFEQCRNLLERYKASSAFMVYATFLYYMKNDEVQCALHMIPQLSSVNQHLYRILTFEEMNTCNAHVEIKAGSAEEAGYIYRILCKIIQTMEHTHIFLTNHKQ